MNYLIKQKSDISKGGIYIITSTKTQTVYIGETINLKKRYDTHIRLLRINKHHNQHLQNIFNLYPDSLSFDILESVHPNNFIDLVRIESMYIIRYLQNGIKVCNKKYYDIDYDKIIVSIETKNKISISNKGKVICTNGNTNIKVSKEEFDNNSNLYGITKHRFIAQDIYGNRECIFKDDNRYLSGDLVGVNINRIIVKDKQGNRFSIFKDDPRYLSGELVGIAKGKVNIKDKQGNRFSIFKDDPRYLSGELVNVNKGNMNWRKHITINFEIKSAKEWAIIFNIRVKDLINYLNINSISFII